REQELKTRAKHLAGKTFGVKDWETIPGEAKLWPHLERDLAKAPAPAATIKQSLTVPVGAGAVPGGVMVAGDIPEAALKPGPLQHINLTPERFGGTDAARRVVIDAGLKNRAQLDLARRGVVSLEESEAAAGELLRGDMEWFWGRKPGQAFNDAQITAARDVLLSAADAVVAAKEAWGQSNNDPVLAARLQEAEAVFNRVHEITEAASAEIGRALGAHRILSQAAENFRGVVESEKADKKSLLAKIADGVFEFYRNVNLLSGPKTHLANIFGNTAGLALRTAGTLAKGAYMPGRYAGEAGAELRGAREALPAAVEAMRLAWSEKIPIGRSKLNEGGQPLRPAIPGTAGKIIRAFGYRPLAAMDAFFKAVLRGSEIQALAYRQARSEGLAGAALQKRVGEIIANRTTTMAKTFSGVEDVAEYWTFQKPLGPAGQHLSRGLRKLPGVRYVVPFVMTPANIAKITLEHTVLNAGRLTYLRLAGKISADEFAEEMSKPIVGTVLQAGLLLLAANGLVTGGGPKDKNKRAAWLRAGYQPYSIKVGKNWYAYNRLEPAGSVMGLAADCFEAAKGDRADLVGKLSMSLGRNLTSKTFLAGISGLMDVISDPERNATSFLRSEVGSLVPSLVNTLAKGLDPTLRSTRSLGATIKGRVPGLSQTLPPRRDLWGRTITRTDTAAERMASPVPRGSAVADPVDTEMIRIGADKIGPPDDHFAVDGKKVALTPEQYDRLAERAGQIAYRMVNAYMNTPGYQGEDDETKFEVVKDLVEAARKAGRHEVLGDQKDVDKDLRLRAETLARAIPVKAKDRAEWQQDVAKALLYIEALDATPGDVRKAYWKHLVETIKTPEVRMRNFQRLQTQLRKMNQPAAEE
ncbi:MAG: hypothetical protein ABIL09_20555, partial [Gemmatimonadota bacterium]